MYFMQNKEIFIFPEEMVMGLVQFAFMLRLNYRLCLMERL